MEVELLVHNNTQLGEGPVWDHRSGTLYWVDIIKGHIQVFNYGSGTNQVYPMNEFTGAVVPTTGEHLLVALKNRVATFNPSSLLLETFCEPESGMHNNRFNDGKCDAAGRFWIGSTEIDHQQPTGTLYCVQKDGSYHPVLKGLHISNGMAWSADHTVLYFIDSPTRKVQAFDFDFDSAQVAFNRDILLLNNETGVPDGMCIDNNGNLWIAFYGGGRVVCFSPSTGEKLEEIEVPAINTTSCCFGGPEMNELFITTAQRDDPQGGGLYKCSPGVSGPTADFFKI